MKNTKLQKNITPTVKNLNKKCSPHFSTTQNHFHGWGD